MRFPAPALIGLTAVAILAANGVALRAQDFSRTLDKIQLFADGGGRDSIRLTFSQPVEADPAIEYGTGNFTLRFSATGSNIPPNTYKNLETSNIRDYRVVQNKYAVSVAVNLRDSALSLEGGLAVARDGNVVRVAIDPAAALAARGGSSRADRELLAQAERRIGGELALTGDPQEPVAGDTVQVGAASAPFEEDWLTTLATMLGALAIVLLVLYGMVFLYQRFLAGRIGGGSGSIPIRQLASYAIGPKQRVVVLDINGEIVACGVTPHQVSLVARLGGPRSGTARKAPPTAEPPGEDGSAAGEKAPRKPAAPAAESKDPVHQFADTLKEKVNALKRIK